MKLTIPKCIYSVSTVKCRQAQFHQTTLKGVCMWNCLIKENTLCKYQATPDSHNLPHCPFIVAWHKLQRCSLCSYTHRDVLLSRAEGQGGAFLSHHDLPEQLSLCTESGFSRPFRTDVYKEPVSFWAFKKLLLTWLLCLFPLLLHGMATWSHIYMLIWIITIAEEWVGRYCK